MDSNHSFLDDKVLARAGLFFAIRFSQRSGDNFGTLAWRLGSARASPSGT